MRFIYEITNILIDCDYNPYISSYFVVILTQMGPKTSTPAWFELSVPEPPPAPHNITIVHADKRNVTVQWSPVDQAMVGCVDISEKVYLTALDYLSKH